MSSRTEADLPGAGADSPTEIRREGWAQILKRSWRETKNDQVPLIAAGVAFYSFLAIFPAAVAAILLYGLVADPATVTQQVESMTKGMPDNAASLITSQMHSLSSSSSQSLGIGLVISVALALWSASGGVGNMITALNIAYDEEETRGFVKRKALALGLTLGAIVFVVLAVGLVAGAPAVLDNLVPSGLVYWLVQVARWLLLLVIVTAMLAVLYRVAPDRDAPRLQWVSLGAVVATVVWLVASIAFSVYVNTFGNYAKTYGAMAGVVVLLLWLWITNLIVLLGAEINSESEHQTARDTTRGAPRPMGERDAVKADTFPDEERRE